MDFIAKKGNTIKKLSGISPEKLERIMDEVLEEHEHLCASCSSNACDGKRGLSQDLIVGAIHTNNRMYVFDCQGYVKKDELDFYLLDDEMTYLSGKNVPYEPMTYPVHGDSVKQYLRRM